MKLRYKLVIVAFFVTVIDSFIWSTGHYYSKYQHEKERAERLYEMLNQQLPLPVTFCNHCKSSIQL